MKFTARVKTDNNEWIDMPIRVILLDKQGKPEVVIGSSGLQYQEFELQAGDNYYATYKGATGEWPKPCNK